MLISIAVRDLSDGFRKTPIGFLLAWQEIKQRYHRTVLGPIWITLNTGAFVFALGLVFSALLGNDISVFLPFLATGIVTWTMIAGILSEAPGTFVSSQHILRSLSFPYTLFLLRLLFRNAIIFAHNLIIIAIVVVIFPISFGAETFLVLAGFLLLLGNCLWMALILAVVGTRFRDISQFVATALQFLFFLTPLVWERNILKGGKLYWVDANPFFHMIELVRAPILGGVPSELTIIYACAMLVIGSLVSILVFARYRASLAYWL